MKIALLIQRFPGGGAEHYVEEIATRLHEKGEDVTVITSEEQTVNESEYDFRIIRLPTIVKLGEYFLWKGLEKLLKHEQFDIVHTNTYGYFHSDKVARLKKKLDFKLVMTSHGFTGLDLHKLKKEKIINRTSFFDFLRDIYDEHIGKKTLLLCDHLIALSQHDVNFYKKLGVDESKISIIPPGVSDVFFEQNTSKIKLKGNPILLSVGQLSWIKNHEMIISIIPYLLQSKSDTHLYLIGTDGGELTNLKNLCKKLQITNHVTFLGSKQNKEVCAYMQSANLLLHTSFAEGLSTVLLESLVVGLPFITTPSGGNGFLVNDAKFGLVTNYDPKYLSQQTLQLLDDKTMLNKMQQNYPKSSQGYLWDNVFTKIFNVYKTLYRSK